MSVARAECFPKPAVITNEAEGMAGDSETLFDDWPDTIRYADSSAAGGYGMSDSEWSTANGERMDSGKNV